MSTHYRAKPLPQFPVLQRELQRIAEALASVHQLEVFHVEPERPTVGAIYYADGSNWDPGSGEGPYIRTSAGWKFLAYNP